MAAWREEDHPRDERGRWIPAGVRAAVQMKRTLERLTSSTDEELLDVYMRIGARDKLSKKQAEQIAALDAELARREAGGEVEPTPEQKRVDELLAEGASYDEAYREAYGGGDSDDTSGRRKGETKEQFRRREWQELAYVSMLEAEEWTRGNMMTKEAELKGISYATLFTGTRAQADKYASEELKRYWAEVNPRRTYAEYRAERVGDSGAAGKAREKRRTAGNGKDFG